MGEPLKLHGITADELVARVENGEIPSRIATELGVTKAAVYYHLSDHPDYQKARKTGMAIRLDEAETNVIDSNDQLSLSRAREAFRAVAWRAEREHPQEWSNKPDIAIQINNISGLEQALTGDAASLLDQLRTVAIQPAATHQIEDAREITDDDGSQQADK